jgi:diguanylate cyclase (GGDEF)-like protein
LLYSEVTILSCIVMVIIAVSAMNMSQSITYRNWLFIVSVLCAAAANVCDFVWNMALTDSWDMHIHARYLMNCGYFLTLGVSMYCWFLYTLLFVNKRAPSIRFHVISAIPLMLLLLLLVVSYINGCAFYIDESGMYHRGKLFYLQHVFSYGYVAAASIVCLRRAMRSDYYDRRQELLMMAAFIIPPLICIVIQSLLQNIPVLAVGIVISYILVYISILQNMISNDELTGISNRKELLRYLSGQIRRDMTENLCFMFMDIDGFKNINDEYGHTEGDRALQAFAMALRQAAAECGGVCARYGGDEFALAAALGEDDAIRVQKRIHDLVKRKCGEHGLKCNMEVSIGCVRYHNGMNGVQELISSADEAMYAVKTAKKRAGRQQQ